MKERGKTIITGIAVLMAIAPLLMIARPAAAQNATAWVDIATTTPGVGCVVDVSVEVQSGGDAASGVDVSIALSEDASGDVLSVDRATTNGSGVAWLALDTSAGWNGAKTWMEVVVNGSYLGGKTIRITDGGCSGNSALLTMDGAVSPVRASSPAASPGRSTSSLTSALSSATSGGSGSSSAVMIPNVWTYQQQRGLSCEYAALSIATGALGAWTNEYQFDAVVPLSENPHQGYRGDITGAWGGTDDYGIYAAPLAPALSQFGFKGHLFYGAGSSAELTDSIDMGRPTLVWLGLAGDTSFDDYAADGTRFQLTPYMHVMVAYGYDDGGVYLSDPGTGEYKYYSWGDFMWMWNVMDGMALGVSR